MTFNIPKKPSLQWLRDTFENNTVNQIKLLFQCGVIPKFCCERCYPGHKQHRDQHDEDHDSPPMCKMVRCTQKEKRNKYPIGFKWKCRNRGCDFQCSITKSTVLYGKIKWNMWLLIQVIYFHSLDIPATTIGTMLGMCIILQCSFVSISI